MSKNKKKPSNKKQFISVFTQKIMAIFKNKYFLFSLLTFLCFIAPSTLYSIFYKNYNFRLDIMFYVLALPLAIGLAFARKGLSVTVLGIFCILELIQFGHIFYFGTPITPFELELIWKEKGEIMESSLDTFPECFIFIFCVSIPYIALIWAYIKKRQKKGFITASVFVLLAFAVLGRRALVEGSKINSFMPRNDMVSLHNTINSFAGLLNRLRFRNSNGVFSKYKPYQVEKSKNVVPDDINIVMIIGESDNPNRMSLFGHNRKTTPNLDKMVETDKNFVYKRALSSGVLTAVSTMMLLNVQREPDNMMHTVKQPTHLFKLAKQNGFTTAYISAQDSMIARGMAPDYVDIWHTREYAPLLQSKLDDLVTLEILKQNEAKLGKKNFIILHQRNIHSPYNKRTENFPQFNKWQSSIYASREEKLKDAYDNAMLVVDDYVSQVINYFKKSKKPTYFFWVPDHSEMLGERGKFGHCKLEIEVAQIPFVATVLNKNDDAFVKKLKQSFMPTHYEIGKTIAGLLGWNIINPNEEDGIFYVNGNIINGDAGWMKIDKRNNKLNYQKKVN